MNREMPPPGPKRDALVAELVFGWKPCISRRCGSYGYHIHEDGLVRPSLWSTQPHLALDVLLEMQRQGHATVLTLKEGGEVVAEMWDGVYGYGWESDVDFAATITAAAIRAKWVKQDAAS